MALSQEQRRALRLLLHTSPYGCDKSMLLARGLKIEMLSGLVRWAVGHGGPADDHRRRAAGACCRMIRARRDHHIAACRARATVRRTPLPASPAKPSSIRRTPLCQSPRAMGRPNTWGAQRE
jgi:hypothetical protein